MRARMRFLLPDLRKKRTIRHYFFPTVSHRGSRRRHWMWTKIEKKGTPQHHQARAQSIDLGWQCGSHSNTARSAKKRAVANQLITPPETTTIHSPSSIIHSRSLQRHCSSSKTRSRPTCRLTIDHLRRQVLLANVINTDSARTGNRYRAVLRAIVQAKRRRGHPS